MPNIKVLPLEYWMTIAPFTDKMSWMNDRAGADAMRKKYPETAVTFSRDGVYKCGKVSWFEVGGKAFEYNAKQFDSDLSVVAGIELPKEKLSALAAIINVGLSTNKQREMYRAACLAIECRNVRRSVRKRMLDIHRK